MPLEVNYRPTRFTSLRADEWTPAPRGPVMMLDLDALVVDGRRVAGRFVIAGDLGSLEVDWGDGSARQPIVSPWRFEHTYAVDSVYTVRALAVSTAGRPAVDTITIQARGTPTGGGPGPATYNDIVLADRPVGFWPLNDAPGSDTLADLSANRNSVSAPAGLTLGVAGLADGETGGEVAPGTSGYFEFDGVDVFGIPWPEEVGANSMEIWADVADPQISQALVALDSYGDYSFVMATYAGSVAFSSHLPPNYPATPPQPLTPGLHHLVGVYTDTALILYDDGEVAQAAAASGTQPLFSVGALGRRGDVEVRGSEMPPAAGRFVKPAFYDYALSQTQIRAHYTAGRLPAPDPETRRRAR